MANPDWYPDPANRYQLRYFDGAMWTRHVSNNGVATEDPVPVGQPAEWQWTFCRSCGAICQFDDDHCWKCISSFPEARWFAPPPQPIPGAPIPSQFEAAQNAMANAFEHAQHALTSGRPKDALRGFDEALWHRHFAEQLMMQLPKNGTSYGLGVSLLTMGLGPTDLIVGPLVRSFVNKRIQNRREQDVASDRLIIQAHGLLAMAELPEMLEKSGVEHEVLVRFAFAFQPPGNVARADHSMTDNELKHFIASQVMRVQSAFPDLNALLCDFAVHYQWVDLGQLLVRCGYPIGHLLTGVRYQHHGGSNSSGNSHVGSERDHALKILGLDTSASPDEIKKAYRALSKKFHPDAQAGASDAVREEAEEQMRRINAAFDTLTRSN